MVGSLEAALDLAASLAVSLDTDEIMIGGGGDIYRQSMALADRLLITRVMAEPEGDAYFPEIDDAEWELIEEADLETGPRDSAELKHQIYRRRSASST